MSVSGIAAWENNWPRAGSHLSQPDRVVVFFEQRVAPTLKNQRFVEARGNLKRLGRLFDCLSVLIVEKVGSPAAVEGFRFVSDTEVSSARLPDRDGVL